MDKKADLVIKNAAIFTSDQKRPWAENLAVAGERFIYVGSDPVDDLIGAGTRVYDAGGKVIIPGMFDGHTHIEPVALSKWRVKLPRTDNLEELLEAAADYCGKHPPDEVPYFFGENYTNEMFNEQGPTRELLDKYISDRPARIQDFTDHGCWFNSLALEYLEMDKDSQNPKGPIGEIEFVRNEDGSPTGWVKEPGTDGLEDPIFNRIGWKPPAGVNEEELLSLLEFFNSYGIIGLIDGLTENERLIRMFHELDMSGKLNMYYEGTSLLSSYDEIEEAVARAKDWGDRYRSRHVGCHTVKFFLDGTNELGDCASLKPFENSVQGSDYGSMNMTEDQLTETVIRLNREKLDFHVHMVCDRAFRTGCNAVERAKKIIENNNEDWNIHVTFAHCELVDRKDRLRAAEIGIIINWSTHWAGGYFGEGAIPYLGRRRWDTMYDFTDMIGSGAVVTFGSDILSWHEKDRGNPFFGMECSHTRVDPEYPLNPETYPDSVRPPEEACLSLEDLIRGYTINGAVPFRFEDDMGSIKEGKLAHFTILKQDLFRIPKSKIHDVTTVAVFFEGRMISGDLMEKGLMFE